MSEVSALVPLVLLTGIVVWWRTGSVLYGLLALVFAPFLWYAGVFVAVIGLALGLPVFYLVYKILF